MIIDISQNQDSVDVSYVGKNNQIYIETIKFDYKPIIVDGISHTNGYHNFVECEESDPFKSNLRSFYDKPIKLETSKYFTHHNVNYFLNNEVPKFFPEQHEKFKRMVVPNPFSVDIETDITDKYGYSTEDKAENPIRSISITDYSMNSILFIVKNPLHPEFNDLDKGYIRNILQEALGSHYDRFEYNFEIKVFETETDMLNYFLDCFRNYFHLILGWNIYKYDAQYIFNRCTQLGLNYKKASPTGKIVKKNVEINESTHITVQIPAHRIIADYMILFKESLIYNNLGRYNLDSIAELILGLKKVTYTGNLRTLYENNYLRFVGYSFIDTILVMLIHRATNLLGVDFFQSFYTGIPYVRLSQNSISEALVYKELISDNQFLLESEKSILEPRKYQGGYVKDPTAKIVGSVAGFDFGSLYPNAMVTVGCSPESKIDVLKCDSSGFPDNFEDKQKWEKYKALGYCLSPMGRVYDVSKDFLFTRIEKKLLAERKIYRGHMEDIFLNVQPKIEEEMKKRNLK